MPIVRRSDCIPLPIVVCPVVAVVKLESRVARCVQCVQCAVCPKHDEILLINNKSLLLHLVGLILTYCKSNVADLNTSEADMQYRFR